jgi:ABC-type phosphate transport system, periplasmic component
VANDALTVVVNPENNWANCLTTQELMTSGLPRPRGRSPTGTRSTLFPDEPLALFGPGTDSGTFDYFTEAINGEDGASRADYQSSEDDNVLVQGVQGARGATSYFGFTYFEENQDTLKAVQVDGGQGCVTPSAQTVQDGTYVPLARPLFIYVSNQAYAEKPQVAGFVDFYAQQIDRIAEAAQFVALNEDQKSELSDTVGQLGQ